ncbi:nucleolin [Phyllostomus discolor]|uniref:Nucleolin n=1 Tax=Phyllostomus discolor TaxID=89673 RepID=A0A834AMM8_9CHIR|nr:nucleolin [Phyllostomus discolor]
MKKCQKMKMMKAVKKRLSFLRKARRLPQLQERR